MKFINFKEVDSTNDKAKENGFPDDFVITALTQRRGRGRLGRRWSSGIGGAWFSIVTKDEQLLCFRASVAVLKTLEELDIKPQTKWPNDLYVNGKKICGILLEKHKGRMIIGIGININNNIPRNLKAKAVSLKQLTEKEHKTIDIIRRSLGHFDKFSKEQNFMSEWKQKCPDIGKEIVIQTLHGKERGVFEDVDGSGFLVLKQGNKRKVIREGTYKKE